MPWEHCVIRKNACNQFCIEYFSLNLGIIDCTSTKEQPTTLYSSYNTHRY